MSLAAIVLVLFYGGYEFRQARNHTDLTVLPLNGGHAVHADGPGREHDAPSDESLRRRDAGTGGWLLRSAMAWERFGAALSLPFAGVHIVEATKQVYRAIPAHRERTRLIPALEPVLVPSSLQRDEV